MPAFIVLLVTLAGLSTATAGPAQQHLSDLSEQRRNELFAAAVASADFACPEVTRTFFKGDNPHDGNAYYAVRCAEGDDYVVLLSNDEQMATQVMSCEIVNAIGSECWAPF